VIKYISSINNTIKGIAAVAIIVGITGCQNTQSTAAYDKQDSQLTNAVAANVDDGMVCKMEKRVGSNMMTRVCRTAEQRVAEAEAGKEGWLRLQRMGQTKGG
jgi:hypothetical protein